MIKKTHINKKAVQKAFIIINVSVLLLITFYYGYRLIYYYRIEHPKQIETIKLGELVVNKNKITTAGDGLYKKDDIYYFKGKSFNNYVWYSGRLWQVVSINENKEIKLVTRDSQSSIAWGGTKAYENSYIYNYLNETENDFSGVFYKSLNNPSNYLTDSSWCADEVSDEVNICNNKVNAHIGLLTINEYNLSGGKDGYLYNGEYWWTINKSSDDKVWFAFDGGLDDTSYKGNTSYSFGVRPSIVLKKDVIAFSGDGSITNPYVIDNADAKVIETAKIGEYITFSDYKWRILSQDESCTKLVMDGFVKEKGEEKEIFFSANSKKYNDQTKVGYYLNNTFYNSLTNKDKLVKTNFEIGSYGSANGFNYASIYDNSTSAYVGLLAVGQLFSNDYANYYMMTATSSKLQTVYFTIENAQIYADFITNNSKIRPVICVKDLTITNGKGTKDNPYLVG